MKSARLKITLPLLFSAAFCLSGCVTAGRFGPPQGQIFRYAEVQGYSEDVRFSDPNRDSFIAWLNKRFERARAAADGSMDILALSGGGAGGVFGAGALKGLTLSGARPQFEMVTGVSTGALIAPFAFLGPAWDGKLEEAYTGGASEGLLKSAGIFSLFRVGLLKDEDLRALVSQFITPALVEAVAKESAKGRILLVATTNLDAEMPVYWDLGVIASRGGEDARKLFIDVLVASASVPGAFPPVMIPVQGGAGPHDEMHVDGGVTAPFFTFPEVAFITGEKFKALEGARIFVVVNGQLDPVEQASQANTIAITLRSSNVALMRLTRTQLLLTSAFAQRQNMPLYFTEIPTNYNFAGPFNFEKVSMRALFDYATNCAKSGRLWLTSRNVLLKLGAGAPSSEPPTCPAER